MLILFVCSSNVGRSQIAESYFNRLSKTHKAISAGTQYKGDQQISPTFKRLLEFEGVSTAGQKPKALDVGMVEKADRVIILCSRAECPVYLLKSGKADFWNIDDTAGKSEEYKARVAKQIKEKVQKLVSELS